MLKFIFKVLVFFYILGVIYLLIMPHLIHYYNPILPDQYVNFIYQNTVVAYFKKNMLLHIFFFPWIYPVFMYGPFSFSFILILLLIWPIFPLP